MVNKKSSTKKKNSSKTANKKSAKKEIHSCFVCERKGPCKKCKFCEHYFCDKHIKPYPASVGINNSPRHEGDSGHPCIPYVIYKEKKDKKKDDKYEKDLDKFLCPGKYSKNSQKSISHSKNYNIVKPINNCKKEYSENYKEKLPDDYEEVFSKEEIKKPKVKKRKKKHRIKFGKIILFLALLGLLFLIYTNWSVISSFINGFSNNKTSSPLDEKTIEIFDYINNYRIGYGSQNLTYSEVLYPYLKEVAKSKDLDPYSFDNSNEFRNFIREDMNLSGITCSYYKTYFIGGTGIEGFQKKFDKDYSSRNLIRNSKYNFGAVYCSIDNCFIFVFYREIDLNSTEQLEKKEYSKPNFLDKIRNLILGTLDPRDNINSTEQFKKKEYSDPSFMDKAGNLISGIFDPKSNIDIGDLEIRIHELVNYERTSRGLRALSLDYRISDIAREHSSDMIYRNFFDHENPSGEDPTDRANNVGYFCRKDYGLYYTEGLGENIAMTPIYSDVLGCGSTTNLESLAECIVDGWMESPGHRKNILTETYTLEGIGVTYSSDNKAYSTQDFC